MMFHGNRSSSPDVEDAVGVRDYLFCVGIHISRDSRGGARSAAVDFGGDAFFDGRIGALFVDACAEGAFAKLARMAVGGATWDGDFRF